MTLAPEPGALAAQLLAAASLALPASLVGHQIEGIGWATVELERAAAEFGASLGLPAAAWTPADRDQLLGAAVLLGPLSDPDVVGLRLILLEPDTEGRLAASLARHGEGVAAVYVADSVAEGVAPGPARSSVAPGPLGRARLVLGGPIWGPHVIVLDAPTNPESLPSSGD